MAYWLESTERKITAALNANDPERAAYVTVAGAWPLLEGLFLAAGRPQPPSGAVRAHLADACACVGLAPEAVIALWTANGPEERARVALRLLRAVLPHLRA
jgi:hypothetical protein